MASNYSLQVENVRFDPTRLLALEAQNIANAETEHRAAEAAYGEIQSKADMFEKLANDVRGKDSQAYQNYINYANTLRQHTDLLATQGVNPALWRNLLQAKSDYSRIIHPIEEAYQARDKEAERQAKYLEQHPHAMFERDAYDMGIDQWMKNPHYRAKSIDREVVANRAMERYKALQNQVMEMVSQSGLTPDAIKRMTPTQVHAYVKQSAPWLYEAMEKRGVSPEEVQRFMTGDSTAINSLLTSVMDETLGMYGLNTWNTDYDHYTAEQNRLRRNDIHNILRSTIEGEAPNAIGESKFTQHTDTESYKWADLAERKRQFDINDAWRKSPENPANKKSGGNGTDPKVHTYYRDFEYLTANPESQTTEAAHLLAIKNLIDEEGGGYFKAFKKDDIVKTANNIFGKDISDVDFSDESNRKKLLQALVDSVKQNTGTMPWSDSYEENQRDYERDIADLINEQYNAPISKISAKEFAKLKNEDFSKLTFAEKIQMYRFMKGMYDSPDVMRELQKVGANFDRDLINDIAKQISTEYAKSDYNPYGKMIDDLIGTEDNDIYDYTTRVNNYIKGATSAYEGAEDNFTASGRRSQSELLWGQSLQGATSEGYATNVHTFDMKGNKQSVKQDDVVAALGINKDGEITRPYRVSIAPIRNKNTGELEVCPMIRTQGYYDDGKYHEGLTLAWNHKSVKELMESRESNLKQMNLNLHKMENVKKSSEFKNIVKNAEQYAIEILKSYGVANPRKRQIEEVKYEYINQQLRRLQEPYLNAYNYHKSEFMRLWGHATGNTNTEATRYEDNTKESDYDAHVQDLG